MAEQVLYEFGGNFQGSAGGGNGRVCGHFKGTLLVAERRGDLGDVVQKFGGGGVPDPGDGRGGAAGRYVQGAFRLAEPGDDLGAAEVGIFTIHWRRFGICCLFRISWPFG